MNKERGYSIIEIPIYEELNWDMDLIVKCLEVIRNWLPNKFPNFPKTIEYDLLAMTNFVDNVYPVIGMYSKNRSDFNNIPDFFDLYDVIEEWVKEIGLEKIKREAIDLEFISWESLKELKSFPARN